MIAVKLSEGTPVRYKIYSDTVFKGSISNRTYKEFTLSEHVSITEDELKKILSFEKSYLFNTLCEYLAKAERAPVSVHRWILKRNLPDEWKHELISTAEKEGFYSQQRYVQCYIEAQKKDGRKSKLQIINTLRQKGIHQRYLSDIAYDDTTAAEKALQKDKKLKNADIENKKKILKNRGFSYEIIEKLLYNKET
jgi:hypothetical protein